MSTTASNNYQVLYADAPYLMRDQNVNVFVNLQMYVGDFLMSAQFTPAGGSSKTDVLTYMIQQSGQTGTATTLIPESVAITPSEGCETLLIRVVNSIGTPLVPDTKCPYVFYGYRTNNAPPSNPYDINYLATPYYFKNPGNGPSSAYVIVNMPIHGTDQIIHSFTPGSDIGSDTDMLTLNVSNSSTATPQTYCAKLGPFSPVAKQVAVQVCVNGTPKGGPKVIKTYGYDS